MVSRPKSVITVCFLSLLLTACRHVEPEPERRSTEAEIRQHIVGEWTATDKSDGYLYPKLIIAEDGTLTGVYASGTPLFAAGGRQIVTTNELRVLVGTWELSGSALRVTATAARLQDARAHGLTVNEWDYYGVIYADEHALVMTPGMSMAGRWRYEK